MKDRNPSLEKGLRIASIALAALTALLAALFIVQTLRLYFAGVSPANQPSPGVYLEQVYSNQTIAAYFAPIAPLAYLWLAFCAGLLILRLLFPAAPEKPAVEGLKEWREKEKLRSEKAVSRKLPDRRLIALGGLILAAALVIFGIFNGSRWDVFAKAVNICTECVGLG